MRNSVVFLRIPPVLAALIWLTLGDAVQAAKIEAVPGKVYHLSKEHGPWMIMVTSLWGDTKEQCENANKAANELVYELRRRNIPAYVYSQDAQIEHLNTFDRLGREQRRVYAAQRSQIGVLAGNYEGIEQPVAQNTLKYIKSFRPKVLKDAGMNGLKEGQGPLNKAFLTVNPLLSPEEVARKKRDPLLVRLNSGTEYSLAENKGKYSLIVASFYGKSQIKPNRFAEFDEKLKSSISLDTAGLDAWQLVKTMRAQGMEAYVFHDRFRSIVTVGAFDSPQDPEARRLADMFGAKYRNNPETNQEVLVSESIQIPGKNRGDPPLKSWIMDPYPELIEIPNLK